MGGPRAVATARAHGLTEVFGPADGSQPRFMALGVLRVRHLGSYPLVEDNAVRARGDAP